MKNEKSGLIYEYNNINDLTNKMKLLFENDKLCIEYGKNAKKQAIEFYSSEVYYKKIISLYDKLLKEKCKNGRKKA